MVAKCSIIKPAYLFIDVAPFFNFNVTSAALCKAKILSALIDNGQSLKKDHRQIGQKKFAILVYYKCNV